MKRLRDCEILFPASFSEMCQKPYGILYYNSGNPRSHDCNHGVFLDFNINLERAVDDLITFYRLRSLIPRVYPSFAPGEREKLLPVLARYGFEFKRMETRLYLQQRASCIMPRVRLHLKRVKKMDPQVCDIINADDGGNWNVEVINKQLHLENTHLLVGYSGDKTVCTAVLHVREGFSRLDDVITRINYRGKGYGRAFIKAILDYHEQVVPGNYLYLWASNPTAIRIYREAGFERLENEVSPWNAWYAPLSRYR